MKIVVLCGGISTERDISIVSGQGVCKALRSKGHQAILLDVFFGDACVNLMDAFPEEYVQTSVGMTVCMPFAKHAHPAMVQAALAAKKQEMMTESGYQKYGD